jgi:hypothetical protein
VPAQRTEAAHRYAGKLQAELRFHAG